MKLLAVVLPLGIAADMLLESFYLVRELFLFVGLTALVILAGAVLVAAGILFQ